MTTILLVGIACLIIGGAFTWIFISVALRQRHDAIITEAKKEEEVIKKEKLFEVKEKGIQMKAEVEKLASARNSKLQSAEAKFKQRELQLNQKMDDLNRKRQENDIIKENLEKQFDHIEIRKTELDKLHKEGIIKLEQIANLSADEAKEKLVESLKEEAKTEAAAYINDIMEEAKMTANKDAKGIVIKTTQRVDTETAIEKAVTVVHL